MQDLLSAWLDRLHFRVCYLRAPNGGPMTYAAGMEGSLQTAGPLPRQMGVSLLLKHPPGWLNCEHLPESDACVLWVALWLWASGCVVINSMIDDFSASGMGYPERKRRTENIYLSIAWNRAVLLVKASSHLFILFIFVAIFAPPAWGRNREHKVHWKKGAR